MSFFLLGHGLGRASFASQIPKSDVYMSRPPNSTIHAVLFLRVVGGGERQAAAMNGMRLYSLYVLQACTLILDDNSWYSPAGAWWEVANGKPLSMQPYADKAGDAAVLAARRGDLELRDVTFSYPVREGVQASWACFS